MPVAPSRASSECIASRTAMSSSSRGCRARSLALTCLGSGPGSGLRRGRGRGLACGLALTTERLLWLRASRSTMKRRVLSAARAVCMSSTCPCMEAAIRAKTTLSIVEAVTYASRNDGRTQSLAAAEHQCLDTLREWPLAPSSGSLLESREGMVGRACQLPRARESKPPRASLGVKRRTQPLFAVIRL